MSVSRRYTSADLEKMPYDEWHRYEIIGGELHVSSAPSWEHQYAADEIQSALRIWSRASGLGLPITVPGVIFTPDDDVIPDLVWVSLERLRTNLDSAGHLTTAPELVVEVLSPGRANERRDRDLKLALYSRQGVDEYWIVDWQRRTVQVYRRGEQGLALVATLTDDDPIETPLLPGFSLPVAQLWPPTL